MRGGISPGTDAPSVDLRGDLFSVDCPTRFLLDRIGGKWVTMVIAVLADADGAEVGFAALTRAMPGVTHKMLASTLQALSRDGLIARRVEDSAPPRVHYRLTPLGWSLNGPLTALRDWAEQHVFEIVAPNEPAPNERPGAVL